MKDLSQKSIEKSKKMWNTILNFLKSTGLDILLFIIILAIVIHRGLLFLIHLNIEKYTNKTKHKIRHKTKHKTKHKIRHKI